ncbi:hypothetical protein, variant 2 [Aphanomyces astaci]|uniref:Uncharacterized protein n=1 Tax=Aphanomyces astaci TaxID=112090 RepID=W4H9U5_APHAT|nr:hypothetical protein, variant 3 [Aphanomyces astaci]XP_009822757.1 hypothetical protein, variant 2 [Aphanomyces astaci]ETV87893.1 hypothetical protein, variant 2 [Aphanomyces astaci]ETV87894.1 hypothetical protein, variant 3 [Aphanomyces astaci]|eukprot:XP_009822756.1 hypothetical protein, variant 3 [Aphanomyces astaci]
MMMTSTAMAGFRRGEMCMVVGEDVTRSNVPVTILLWYKQVVVVVPLHWFASTAQHENKDHQGQESDANADDHRRVSCCTQRVGGFGCSGGGVEVHL